MMKDAAKTVVEKIFATIAEQNTSFYRSMRSDNDERAPTLLHVIDDAVIEPPPPLSKNVVISYRIDSAVSKNIITSEFSLDVFFVMEEEEHELLVALKEELQKELPNINPHFRTRNSVDMNGLHHVITGECVTLIVPHGGAAQTLCELVI